MSAEGSEVMVEAITRMIANGFNEVSLMSIPLWAQILIIIGAFTLVRALIRFGGYGILTIAYIVGSFRFVKDYIKNKETRKAMKVKNKMKEKTK